MWSPPTPLPRTDLTVVACTTHFFDADYVTPFTLPDTWGGGRVRCDFTNDTSRMHDADALWFHAPTLRWLPAKKREGQRWILMSMESEANYPLLTDGELLRRFDLLMTYRLDSDVPCPYPNRHDYDGFARAPLATQRKGRDVGLALYTASNPVAARDDLARELARYIDVDAPGRCLNNMTLPGFSDGEHSWARRGVASVMGILPRYKFYLAFENSLAEDYVTERVFLALAAGVVPVYRGAPNIREFLPAHDAAIVVSDFDSPRQLADYLIHLDRNDEAYERHLAWKRDGVSESFEALLDLASVDPRQRMAAKLAHGCGRECNCGGRLRGT